jgi:hypothetical protein
MRHDAQSKNSGGHSECDAQGRVAAGGDGQSVIDNQVKTAVPAKSRHRRSAKAGVVAREGQLPVENQDPHALSVPAICAQIISLSRRHVMVTATKVAVVNRVCAYVRQLLGFYEATAKTDREKIRIAAMKVITEFGRNPEADQAVLSESDTIVVCMAILEAGRMDAEIAVVEKQMRQLARQLPAFPWVDQVRGFSDLGLAIIIGEAGDLSNYDTVCKLRKRAGYAPFDGKASSTWRRSGGLANDEWIKLGGSGQRQARFYAYVALPLFQAQGAKADKETGIRPAAKGAYGEAYYARRAKTLITHPEWADTKKHPGRYHKDALRVMMQALLRDLWLAWRAAKCDMEANVKLPPQPMAAE